MQRAPTDLNFVCCGGDHRVRAASIVVGYGGQLTSLKSVDHPLQTLQLRAWRASIRYAQVTTELYVIVYNDSERGISK